jgi:ATP-grasp domain
MRTILFDLPVGREAFLARASANGELSNVELASHVVFDAFEKLGFSLIHRLPVAPSNVEGNVYALARLLDGEPARIVTFNEGAVATVSALQHRFSPPETWVTSWERATRSKSDVRDRLAQAGLPQPSYVRLSGVEQMPENLFDKGPCVAKPDSGMGGRSVRLVHNRQELNRYFEDLAPQSTLLPVQGAVLNLTDYWGTGHDTIVESYVAGEEFSAEIVVHGGSLVFAAVTRKLTSGAPLFLELAHSTLNVEALPLPRETLQEDLTSIVAALRLVETVAHVEFKVVDGRVWVIEVNLRPAGGHITEIWRRATGFDLCAAQLSACSLARELIESTDSSIFPTVETHAAVLHPTLLGGGTCSHEPLNALLALARRTDVVCEVEPLYPEGALLTSINTECGVRYARVTAICGDASGLRAFLRLAPEALLT